MTEGPADIALLARILNGDATGLASLLDRHWASVVRYSHSILNDRDAAEDVAQEVFVRLWEHRETWGLEGSVCGLLFRIARNLSLDECRQRAARSRAANRLPEPTPRLSPAEHAENGELRHVLDKALEDLPQRRREVFVLVRHHGLSYREAADVLGLAPQTVANHLSMALTDLRKQLLSTRREWSGYADQNENDSSVRLAGGALGA